MNTGGIHAGRKHPAGLPGRRGSLAAAGILGTAYLAWIRAGLPAVPCMFRILTGLKCPGCGITSMAVCLSRLDFRGAYEANPFLAVTGIPLAICLAWGRTSAMRGRPLPHWHDAAAAAYAAALAVFWIWRNIT